jgi:hypothetical protein
MNPLAEGLRLYYSAVLLGARRYDDALAQARVAVRAQPGNLPALGVLVVAAHMKREYADAIAANAACYEGMGRQDVAEVLKKGYAESGYAGALRQATWRSMEGSQAWRWTPRTTT